MHDRNLPVLDKLTIDDFTACVNSSFELVADSVQQPLKLIETSTHGSGGAGARTSFSIVFRGSGEQPLKQGTYTLRHESMGELALFIVPIGPDGTDMLYEAVFN